MDGLFLHLDVRRKYRFIIGPLVTCALPRTVTCHHVSVPTTLFCCLHSDQGQLCCGHPQQVQVPGGHRRLARTSGNVCLLNVEARRGLEMGKSRRTQQMPSLKGTRTLRT